MEPGRGPEGGDASRLRDSRRAWLAGAAALAGAVLILYLLRRALPPFLLGLFLAYLLAPAVDRLQAKGLRRRPAILAVYALAAALTTGFVLVAVPEFAREMEQISASLPAQFARAERLLGLWREQLRSGSLPAAIGDAVVAELQRWQHRLEGAVAGTVRGAAGLVAHLWTLILAPVIAFYLLAELPRWRVAADRVARGAARRRWWRLLAEWDRVLAGFVRGQLLVAGAVGGLVALGLHLLGLPYALLLGLLAAVTDLMPYFGPLLGAAPGVLLAAAHGWPLAVKAVLLYTAVQTLESTVLVPVLVGRRVGLHPLAVILALLVGGGYLGLTGFILAVPVAACLRVLGRWLLALAVEEAGRRGPAETPPGRGGVAGRADLPRREPRGGP